jgi:hypothetical protein
VHQCVYRYDIRVYFFLIAKPTIVHDITAYIIYSTHDKNRNMNTKHNFIYRLISLLPLPLTLKNKVLSPLILCPVISIFLTYPLTHNNNHIASYIVILLSLLHFHFESFLWKKGNPHRRCISFKN